MSCYQAHKNKQRSTVFKTGSKTRRRLANLEPLANVSVYFGDKLQWHDANHAGRGEHCSDGSVQLVALWLQDREVVPLRTEENVDNNDKSISHKRRERTSIHNVSYLQREDEFIAVPFAVLVHGSCLGPKGSEALDAPVVVHPHNQHFVAVELQRPDRAQHLCVDEVIAQQKTLQCFSYVKCENNRNLR